VCSSDLPKTPKPLLNEKNEKIIMPVKLLNKH